MQVTHERDHVTHAVIGGRKTIDFGISDSPEFFNILSSTLYTDQILAVVREVLCNAWDIHIETGRTDIPVEVTLDENYVIFRDFGTGISDDDMGPRYGIYGASTKKENGQVTGGFGLGCKAPFAVTDHFEVISFHNGRKTIYNLSKSSAEVNGKPGIIPIASFPTEESGLQVKVPVSSMRDYRRYEQLISRIVLNGEMKVKLNGTLLPVCPFSTMKDNFMLTPYSPLESNARICVRYGNVIYPVENHDDYRKSYQRIEEFLGQLYNFRYHNHLIFQAPPHSISVTPSRESLSMQEHTIKTLTMLLDGFVEKLDAQMLPESYAAAEEAVKKVWINHKPKALFEQYRRLPGYSEYPAKESSNEHFVELPPVIRKHVAYNYPTSLDFRLHDLKLRIDSMIQSGFGNTSLLKSYRSELIRSIRRKQGIDLTGSAWVHKHMIWPVLRDLQAANLKTERLFVYTKNARKIYDYGSEFIQPKKFPKPGLERTLPFLRNIVVLSHNRGDVTDRVAMFPIIRHWLGGTEDFLVYIVPRNTRRAAEAREFFAKRDVHLIDLTVSHPWEPKDAAEPIVRAPSLPRKKGIPTLLSLLDNGIRMDWLDYPDEEHDIKRTETPEIIVQLPRGRRTSRFETFSSQSTDAIAELWGTRIGVTINRAQSERYFKNGAKPLKDWVVEEVCKEMQSNKRIQEFHKYDFGRSELHYGIRHFFEVIYSDPILRAKFGAQDNRTHTDLLYCRIWEDISNEYRAITNYPSVKTTLNQINAIQLDPCVAKLQETIKNSLLANSINLDNLLHMLRPKKGVSDSKKSKQQKELAEKARAMLLLALSA